MILLTGLLVEDSLFAAQVYLQKDIEYENTREIMNRVIDRIEQTEGFVIGETDIYIIGSLADSPLMEDHDNFIYYGNGLIYGTSLAGKHPTSHYFENMLNYPNNVYNVGEIDDDDFLEAALDMDVFPAVNSVKNVNGTIVVKLADTYY